MDLPRSQPERARPARPTAVRRRRRIVAVSVSTVAVLVATVSPWGALDDPATVAEAADPPVPTLSAVAPARLVDTRPGQPTVDGWWSGGGLLRAGSTYRFEASGRGGIPYDVDAVLLNVTAVDPTAPGHLIVHGCGTRPDASSLNFRPGEVTGNMALAPVSGRNTCIYASAATHVVVDVSAYVPIGGAPISVVPARLLETRPGHHTVDGRFQATGPRAGGSTLALEIAGRAGVPDDAAAVMLNVTAVGASGPGHVTLHRCDEERPDASQLNHPPVTPTGNATLAQLDADGRTCVYTSADTDLVVDVSAYVPDGGAPVGVRPARLLETRSGHTSVDGRFQATGSLTAGSTLELQVTGRAGIPADAVAVMVNITAVEPSERGYVTLHPCNVKKPTVSHLNYPAGRVTGNSSLAKLDRQGRVCVYTRSDTELVIDVTSSVTSLASAAERAALTAFYESTDGPNWTRSQGWLLDADPCAWRGVTCDLGGVWGLGLPSNGLTGPIPQEFGALRNLNRAYLVDNRITSLPDEVRDLDRLRRLNLGDNRLRSLPTGIGDLELLAWLAVTDNEIVELPPEIGDLPRLWQLDLRRNQLTALPAEIGALSTLEYLDVGQNRLAQLPPEIGELDRLQWALFGGNDLSGDLTDPLAALRAGAGSLSQLTLAGRGCPTIADPELRTWVEGFDRDWDIGCG